MDPRSTKRRYVKMLGMGERNEKTGDDRIVPDVQEMAVIAEEASMLADFVLSRQFGKEEESSQQPLRIDVTFSGRDHRGDSPCAPHMSPINEVKESNCYEENHPEPSINDHGNDETDFISTGVHRGRSRGG